MTKSTDADLQPERGISGRTGSQRQAIAVQLLEDLVELVRALRHRPEVYTRTPSIVVVLSVGALQTELELWG
jgi:hypothetical protein